MTFPLKPTLVSCQQEITFCLFKSS
uniref:Uncharacterized protein n=1 Tax=Rhizophora mucronata TaxID=61149 RepID=A0A2P2R1D4_RHIMU